MRAADAFRVFSAVEIRVARRKHEPPRPEVRRIGHRQVAKIGDGQQRRYVGIVHEVRMAESVDFVRVDSPESIKIAIAVLLNASLYIDAQSPGVSRNGPVAPDVPLEISQHAHDDGAEHVHWN